MMGLWALPYGGIQQNDQQLPDCPAWDRHWKIAFALALHYRLLKCKGRVCGWLLVEHRHALLSQASIKQD